MSRIGKSIIHLPSEVKLTIHNQNIKVEGPKGILEKKLDPNVEVIQKENQVEVRVKNPGYRNLWGTSRTLIANMIIGVTEGFKKELELVGVGYRAQVEGEDLILALGFSHPVKIESRGLVKFQVEKNKIIVSGQDKEIVGNVAAKIRSLRKPEPYKGKGVRYVGEIVKRKAGKAAKAVGGPAAGG